MRKLLTAFFVLTFLTTGVLADVGIQKFPMFVSEYFLLEKDYQPNETIDISKHIKTSRSPLYMEKEAGLNFIDMMNALNESGITNAYAQSGFRSFSYQTTLFNNEIAKQKKKGYSNEKAYNIAKSIVAVPGGSEHQTGLSIDISINGSLTASFENTEAGIWLAENSYKYGFILRYPKDKMQITGIIFEPWHFRYVGVVHSTIMKREGLCLDEYFNSYLPAAKNPLSMYVFYQIYRGNLPLERAFAIDTPISRGEFLRIFGISSNNDLTIMTREESAIFIGNIMNLDVANEEITPFSDNDQANPLALPYLSKLQKAGIFCCYANGNIDPKGTISIGAACDIALYLENIL